MSERLEDIAEKMVAPGQGILAADESTGTIKKRFDTINVESTEDNRRAYREMLFSAHDAMKNYISGVILFDETLRQKAANGSPLSELIKATDTLAGIKVDKGAQALAGSDLEKVTEGLDGLRGRLREYYELGARFAKWRSVITICDGYPSWNCIQANAHGLARYAALCQEAHIVPIVEPEVLMDGDHATHDIDRCYEVTAETLRATFDQLVDAGVMLEGIVLKPNMIIAGQHCASQASAAEVAEKTVRCLKERVPAAVPGIAFLSGGQSDRQATEHLSLMNEMGNLPWQLTFSYGRALQAAALKTWGGRADNVPAAQQAFSHRARMNSLAARGQWQPNLENAD
ncbi:MAG: class I fructose-bisphosphate aldolase [Pseudomonadota bacterium]